MPTTKTCISVGCSSIEGVNLWLGGLRGCASAGLSAAVLLRLLLLPAFSPQISQSQAAVVSAVNMQVFPLVFPVQVLLDWWFGVHTCGALAFSHLLH